MNMTTQQTKRITIQHIADRADVSISTVSRVLSGSAGVKESKRAAVMRAVDDLDYRPNLFARGLASGNSMSIGILTQRFGSPFYDGILRGIISGLDGSGYSPLVADGEWRVDTERRSLQTLLDRRVDGVILLGPQITGQEMIDLRARLPIFVVGRRIEQLEACCLTLDNYKAGYEATKFLIDHGHRQIAHITGLEAESKFSDAARRLDGYRDALRDAGVTPVPELVVEGNFLTQSGVLAVETLFSRGKPFSAIFAANDQMAIGARLGLFRRNIRVPDDISMIGLDDQPMSAYMLPPLTTIRQPAEEMGHIAADIMLKQLNDEPFTLPKLSTDLIIRESVRHVF
jgi:LacI family transcriptional regulator